MQWVVHGILHNNVMKQMQGNLRKSMKRLVVLLHRAGLLAKMLLAGVVDLVRDTGILAAETLADTCANLVEAQLLLVEAAEQQPEDDASNPGNDGERAK